jgi:hypothetical protein
MPSKWHWRPVSVKYTLGDLVNRFPKLLKCGGTRKMTRSCRRDREPFGSLRVRASFPAQRAGPWIKGAHDTIGAAERYDAEIRPMSASRAVSASSPRFDNCSPAATSQPTARPLARPLPATSPRAAAPAGRARGCMRPRSTRRCDCRPARGRSAGEADPGANGSPCAASCAGVVPVRLVPPKEREQNRSRRGGDEVRRRHAAAIPRSSMLASVSRSMRELTTPSAPPQDIARRRSVVSISTEVDGDDRVSKLLWSS